MVESAAVENYLNITRDDYDALNPVDVEASTSAQEILKEFRSLECTVCTHHFGFQHRWDPKIIICTPRCLSIASNKLRALPPGQHPYLKQITACPTSDGEVPRQALQGLDGVHNTVKTLTPCYREVNGIRPGAEREFDLKRIERDSVSRIELRGSTASRGGRTGGYGNTGSRTVVNVSRAFGGGRGSSDEAHRMNVEETGKNNLDEIDSRADEVDYQGPLKERNKENMPASSHQPKVVTQLDAKRESALAAARQARVVRPKPSDDAASLRQEVSQHIAPSVTKEVEAKNVPATTSPAITPTTKTAPVITPIPTVPVVKPVELKPQKKIWNTKDMMHSLSLVNNAPVAISFPWDSTAKITVNAVADLDKINKIQSDIESYVTTAPRVTRIPNIGDVVFAPYDGVYYRGVVDKVNADEKEVTVTFIDFGDASTVKLENCREPDEAIMRDNMMYGVIFKLKLKEEWPKNLEKPNEFLAALNEELIMEFNPQDNATNSLEWSGKLYLGDKCLNEMLEKQIVASKPASAKLPPTNAVPKPVVAPVPSTSPPKPAPPTTAPPAAAPPAAAPSAAASPAAAPASSRLKLTNPFGAWKPAPLKRTIHTVQWSPNLDGGAVVHVNYVWNYQKMTVSAIEDDDKLQNLQTYLQSYAAEAPPMQRVPSVDEIVIGPYDGMYYRGKVTAVEANSVQLEFLDYGDTVKLPMSELRELNSEIISHPIYGVVLLMEGVPENPPRIASLEELQPEGGQLEVVKMETSKWMGRLWLNAESSWNDLVLDYLK